MAIVIFITHGRQEYCLTKHLIIIFNTGFCITLILAAVTPCARRPGNGIDRGRYGGRLLQAGCVVVYGKKPTYWSTLDLKKIKFENWMDLIFCLFQTWILQATQVVKVKFENRQRIKFIQLDFSNSIFEISSADQ